MKKWIAKHLRDIRSRNINTLHPRMHLTIPQGLSAKERLVYEKVINVARRRAAANIKPPRLVVITDLAKDYDDLAAMVLLKEFHRIGLVQLLGFVANLMPARERARFGRGALDSLGLKEIPIAVGSKATDVERSTEGFEFDCDFMSAPDSKFEEGQMLLRQICSVEAVKRGKITFLLISSLSDIAKLARDRPELLKKVTERVVMQGGYSVDEKGILQPDSKSANNRFDFEAATSFHKFMQDERIPSIVFTKIAAYATPLTTSLFTSLEATGHRLGRHLRRVQIDQDVHYYLNASDPDARFQPHMDEEWFLRNRSSYFDTKRLEGAKYPVGKEVVPYLTKAVMYDVLAALGAVGDDLLIALEVLKPGNEGGNEIHRIVGAAPGDTGIQEQQMADVISAILKGSLLAAMQNMPSS